MVNRSGKFLTVVPRFTLVLLIVFIVIINHGQQSQAIKKKKMLKKIKDAIPLLLALKPKKKILLLPVPIPMKNKFGNGLNGIGNALISMNPLAGLRGQNSWGGSGGSLGIFGTGGLPSFQGLSASNFANPSGNGFGGSGYGQQARGPKMMMIVPSPLQKPTSSGTSWPSNIDQMNNMLMNQAMDEWMMMAAMDCFGMDNMIHEKNRHHEGAIRENNLQSRPYYKSPAQIARDNQYKLSHQVNQHHVQQQQQPHHQQIHHDYPQQQQQIQQLQHPLSQPQPQPQLQQQQYIHFEQQKAQSKIEPTYTFRPELAQQQYQASHHEKENVFESPEIKGNPHPPTQLTSTPSLTTQTNPPVYFGEDHNYGQRLNSGQATKGRGGSLNIHKLPK